MPLISRLRCLPAAMGRCKYSRGSCSIICSRVGIESNIRQLYTPTLLQSPLSVPLFPPSSTRFTLLYYPNKNSYGCNNRGFSSSDEIDVSPVSYEERWDMMYQELVEYKEDHGDTLVPAKHPDNPQLVYWVDKQRQNRKKNKLAPGRVDKLNEIGFVWDPFDDAWNEVFLQLVDYKDKHGDTLVPQNYADSQHLGKWVINQRQKWKNNQLTYERVDKLNEIGFVWDAKEATWEDMLQQLKQYKDKYGDTLVPKKYPDNLQLGKWVLIQRQYKKNNKLAPGRVDKLNEIGFVWVWDPFDDAWNEMFLQLMKYKDEHFDTLVPQKYPDNQQLGKWVDRQRQNRKKNKVAPGRVDKLNEIGFVWDPFEDSWNEMFQQIVDYEDKHGDTLVPRTYPDNPQLGMWVVTQRQYKMNKKLAPGRVDKLNEIGFVWDPFEDSWNEMFQQIVVYKDKHGDTLVPAKYPDNPQLGKWVDTQRQSEKNNKLASERIDKLNDIGFVWDAHEAAWHTKYNKLCSFYKRYGHTSIPFGKEEDEEIYYWCMRQRYSKAKGRMKDHRYDQLKKINFDFFFREIAKGSSLIENMIIYELERMGHEFDMLNQVFFNVKNRYRPDGVMFIDEVFTIFFEVDEKYHEGSHYPKERELGRMVALRKEAVVQGYDQVIFVRIGTGDQRKVNESQLQFVSKHLHELKSSTQPKPSFSVHYIDYPDGHHHAIASKERFNEVKVLTSK